MLSRLVVVALALAFATSTADAHLRVTSHQARYGDSQKAAPCGVANGERTTDKVYIGKPGIDVMIIWEETVGHPGFYRIDFDLDGDDDFADPLLAGCDADPNNIDACFDRTNDGSPYMANDIPDVAVNETQNYLYTLPNEECSNCTLQVLQVMTDKMPYNDGNEFYYHCVDIILSADGPDELTLIEVDPPDGGMGGDGDGDGDGDGMGGASGGCAASGSGASPLALILVGALLLGWRRRLK